MAAIAAFEASLAQAPRDGWALWGMMRAWDAVSNVAEDRDGYRKARAAFRKAWLGDDATLDLNRL